MSRPVDPAIEAWLADGPSRLSPQARAAVLVDVHATRQRRRRPWRDWNGRALRLVAVAAALAVLAAALAAVAGSPRPFTTITPPTLQPSLGPTGAGSILLGRGRLPDGGSPPPWALLKLRVTYWIPDGLDLGYDDARTIGDGLAAFTQVGNGPPVPHPDEAHREGVTIRGGSRGVIVAQLRSVTLHDMGPMIGDEDASALLARLDESSDYTVSSPETVTLDGRAALWADVRLQDPTAVHQLDFHDGADSIDFAFPSRLFVSDVGQSIVAVQVWAMSEADLEAWLPQATRFVATLRFTQE